MKTKADTRDKMIDKTIGANIRRLRTESGISQGVLGILLGVRYTAIQKYERGVNSVAAARIPALCGALDISVDELFEGTLTKLGRKAKGSRR